MIDAALNMLGPDTETLTEILTELGERHVRYGVVPAMYPAMGRCLVDTLEEVMQLQQETAAAANNAEVPPRFALSSTVKEAWKETYDAMADDMIEVYRRHSLDGNEDIDGDYSNKRISSSSTKKPAAVVSRSGSPDSSATTTSTTTTGPFLDIDGISELYG